MSRPPVEATTTDSDQTSSGDFDSSQNQNAESNTWNVVRNRKTRLFVAFCILVVMAVIAWPLVMEFWKHKRKPRDEDLWRNESRINCQIIDRSVLESSICKDHLPWLSWDSESSSVNMSVRGCGNYNRSEMELKALWNLVRAFQPECIAELWPFACRYAYSSCVYGDLSLISKCNAVKEGKACKEVWERMKKTLNSMTASSCLKFPHCAALPTLPPSKRVPIIPIRNNSNSSLPSPHCVHPLVNTSISTFPIRCSPKCLPYDWEYASELTVVNVVLPTSMVFWWICFIILSITFFNVKEVRRFPTITSYLLAFSCILFVLMMSVPIMAGRETMFCNHPDFISSLLSSSLFCRIQGVITQFGPLSGSFWWACSVFNILITVWCLSVENVLQRYWKQLFAIEATISYGIPALLVAAVFWNGDSYALLDVSAVMCGPSDQKMLNNTYEIPFQLGCFVGSVMIIFILIRLREAEKFEQGLPGETANIKRRSMRQLFNKFFVVALAFPLLFSCIMSAFLNFPAYVDNFTNNIYFYIACVQNRGDDSFCTSMIKKNHKSLFILIQFVLLDVLFCVVVYYCLVPVQARKFWARQKKKFKIRLLAGSSYSSSSTSTTTGSRSNETVALLHSA